MPARCLAIALSCALTLAACGGGQGPAPQPGDAAAPAVPAATPAESSAPPADAGQPAATAAEPSAAPAADGDMAARLAAADVEKGKVLFLQCRACHSLVPENEPGKIGPTLYGVIGRPAGSAPGYDYSQAVKDSGITWTPELIDKWLARPSDFLPGNKMVFVGVQDPQDRANIIAFIQQESSKPAP